MSEEEKERQQPAGRTERLEGLQGAVVRGALVQLSTSLPAKVMGVGLTLLATRALSPTLYGEYHLAATIYGVSDLLTNPSVATYFVRTPDASQRALDSSWTVTAARGALLTLLFWWAAPTISGWFGGGEQVALLLQLLSTTFFIAGVRNPYIARIYHKLDYEKIALVEALGQFLGNALGVALLWWTQSPAALAAGGVLSHLVSCAMTWWYAPQRPSVCVDTGELRVIWQFVRFLAINNIIIYLLMRLDDVFLGKLAGLGMLGLYSLSYKVANDSVLFLITTLRQVLLPAFVKLVDDAEAFREAALRAVGTLSCISWVLSATLWAGADELMGYVAPGPRWAGASLILQALMPFVLIRAVNGVYGSVMLAKGVPGVLSRVAGAQLVALLPTMWLGYWAGEQVWEGGLGGVLGVTAAIAALNYGANVALMRAAREVAGMSAWRGAALMWVLGPVAAVSVAVGMWAGSFVGDVAWARMLVSMGVTLALSVAGWEALSRLSPGLDAQLDRPMRLARRLRRKRAS